ncbi:MAG TPA: hypothetical protein VFK14_00940, partial [Solirubrobacterales bacterium]|nr:hypothetical protein [Solirubrobacterales bacterium]
MLIEGRPSVLDALFAFGIALALTWLLVPLTERLARRVGAIDQLGAPLRREDLLPRVMALDRGEVRAAHESLRLVVEAHLRRGA